MRLFSNIHVQVIAVVLFYVYKYVPLHLILSSVQQESLKGFTLTTFSSSGNVLDAFTDSSITPEPIYDIYLTSLLPVKSLTIVPGKPMPVGQSVLTLCEVETFGGGSILFKDLLKLFL